MAKLVVLQPDGTTRDVILDRERLTIGRRVDNDVCLPFPAVSGEHAQVVTILADSFLEDLGSTNGTIVNGKSIAKHFLNDHDLIDIGRQRLTYLSDNDAKPIVLLGDRPQAQLQGLLDRVPPAQVPHVEVPPSRGGGRPPRPIIVEAGANRLLVDLQSADAAAIAGINWSDLLAQGTQWSEAHAGIVTLETGETGTKGWRGLKARGVVTP